MADYLADVKKYSPDADEAIVAKLVKDLALVLKDRDSSLVAASDQDELDRVRDGFAKKRLGLSAEAAEAGIKDVVAKMKGDRSKSRVTFYYLLAEATGTLSKLG